MAHILIIDDDLSIRQIVALILARVGHSVAKAADGAEGIALLRARSVDLVITDLIMPGVDGVQAIVGLRRDSPDLPIIAMSGAMGTSDDPQIARLLGTCCTLQKPFGTEELLGVVDRMLQAASLHPPTSRTGAPATSAVRSPPEGRIAGSGRPSHSSPTAASNSFNRPASASARHQAPRYGLERATGSQFS